MGMHGLKMTWTRYLTKYCCGPRPPMPIPAFGFQKCATAAVRRAILPAVALARGLSLAVRSILSAAAVGRRSASQAAAQVVATRVLRLRRRSGSGRRNDPAGPAPAPRSAAADGRHGWR